MNEIQREQLPSHNKVLSTVCLNSMFISITEVSFYLRINIPAQDFVLN